MFLLLSFFFSARISSRTQYAATIRELYQKSIGNFVQITEYFYFTLREHTAHVKQAVRNFYFYTVRLFDTFCFFRIFNLRSCSYKLNNYIDSYGQTTKKKKSTPSATLSASLHNIIKQCRVVTSTLSFYFHGCILRYRHNNIIITFRFSSGTI